MPTWALPAPESTQMFSTLGASGAPTGYPLGSTREAMSKEAQARRAFQIPTKTAIPPTDEDEETENGPSQIADDCFDSDVEDYTAWNRFRPRVWEEPGPGQQPTKSAED